MMSIVEMSKVEIFQNPIFYSSDTFLVVTHNVSEVDPSCISSGNFDSKKCQKSHISSHLGCGQGWPAHALVSTVDPEFAAAAVG